MTTDHACHRSGRASRISFQRFEHFLVVVRVGLVGIDLVRLGDVRDQPLAGVRLAAEFVREKPQCLALLRAARG